MTTFRSHMTVNRVNDCKKEVYNFLLKWQASSNVIQIGRSFYIISWKLNNTFEIHSEESERSYWLAGPLYTYYVCYKILFYSQQMKYFPSDQILAQFFFWKIWFIEWWYLNIHFKGRCIRKITFVQIWWVISLFLQSIVIFENSQ